MTDTVEHYDVAIIGAGSAGMSAGIYAARFGLTTVILGKVVGGLLNDSHKVENYPGFVAIPGFDLMMKFKEHVDAIGVPIKEENVTRIEKKQNGFVVTTENGAYESKTIILATGTKHRHLGVPREEEMLGRGVSYCATCDGPFFKEKTVAIVGGGDSAAQAGALLAQHATKVYVIVRGEKMRAEPLNIRRLETNPKVKMVYNASVTELMGADALEGIKLKVGDGKDAIALQGLFIEIGADVQTELAAGLGVALNERKEIVIDVESRTNVPGVFGAGDCANRKFKQAITGAAEGVIAAFSAYDHIKRLETGESVEIGY